MEGIQRTEENGLPLSVVLSGANTHDVKLLEKTLDHIVIFRPEPEEDHPQNLCLDAGYTGSGEKARKRGYTPHVRPRGEEKKALERNPDFHARRWTVKVTHSFFNRFRKLLVRFEKKPPIIWPCFHWPAPLLSGVNSSRLIDNFRIGSKYCRSAQKTDPNDMRWYDSAQAAEDNRRRICGNCKK